MKTKAAVLEYLVFSRARASGAEVAARARALRPLVLRLGDVSLEAALTAFNVASIMASWRDYGLSRRYINAHASRIRAFARWVVAQGWAKGTVVPAIECARPYRAGAPGTVDRPPVLPVERCEVDRVLPFLPPMVAAMVELAWHTGARMGELTILRPCDVDRSGEVWIYRPRRHKTMAVGGRIILIDEAARAVLQAALERWGRGPEDYLFAPCLEAVRTGRGGAGARPPGEVYSTAAVAKAIRRACLRAKTAPWGPHRLRHAFATRAAAAWGALVASRLLGHRSIRVTEAYIGPDLDLLALVKKGL
ncbi:MAG: site-specific integrase [Candidatus Omnitrophica bacterium]|nr:site-specific integrase [Candidatus Omnitrophota bacterium]